LPTLEIARDDVGIAEIHEASPPDAAAGRRVPVSASEMEFDFCDRACIISPHGTTPRREARGRLAVPADLMEKAVETTFLL